MMLLLAPELLVIVLCAGLAGKELGPIDTSDAPSADELYDAARAGQQVRRRQRRCFAAYVRHRLSCGEGALYTCTGARQGCRAALGRAYSLYWVWTGSR